jgi:hypothetical protein
MDKNKQNLRHISNHSTCEMESYKSPLGLSIHIRTAMVTECGLWDGYQGNTVSVSETIHFDGWHTQTANVMTHNHQVTLAVPLRKWRVRCKVALLST